MIRRMIDFIKSHNRLNHMVVAGFIMIGMLPVAWLLDKLPVAAWAFIPAVAAIWHFFGRERAQYQRWLANRKGVTQTNAWLAAFAFWKWTPDGKADFYWPAGFAIAVTIAIIAASGRLF